MSDNGTYNNIEDLFRSELGNRDYPVRDGFWTSFEKKLRFREFLRFRPGSFNVYYLGTIVTAAIVSASLLLSGNKDIKPAPVTDIIIEKDTVSAQQQEFVVEEDKQVPDKDSTDKKSLSRKILTPGKEYEGQDTEPAGAKTREEHMPGEAVVAKGSTRVEVIDKKEIIEKIAVPPPVARFTADKSDGCLPLTVSFENLSHNYDSCIWEFGDGGRSYKENPVWVFDNEGSYEVNLILFGKGGSGVKTVETVTVYPKPVARFEISQDNPYIPDEQIRFYNYSQNAVEWEWDFGDGNTSSDFEPAHFYDKPGSYTVSLKAISEYGCVDSMVLTNAFGNNTCYIKFPNAFVPNDGGPTGGYYSNRSDQQEEVFHPVCSGVTSYNLRIYSRRGILVFESNDIQIGWDGYYKGQEAEPGVYIWKVRGVYKNGEPFVKGGDVTLLPRH